MHISVKVYIIAVFASSGSGHITLQLYSVIVTGGLNELMCNKQTSLALNKAESEAHPGTLTMLKRISRQGPPGCFQLW